MGAEGAVSIEVLRPLRLRIVGAEVPAGPPRQQAVLAFLAVHAGDLVSRDELIDAVWGEAAPRSVTGILHTYMSALRRIFRNALGNESPSFLLATSSGYGLDLQVTQLDFREFEHELALAAPLQRSDSPVDALPLWRSALRRWSGAPLAGIDAPFVAAERARLTALRLSATTGLAEVSLKQGTEADTLAALGALELAIEDHLLHERLAELRIEILNVRGRRAEALAQFERTTSLLADQLGIDPGYRLRDAYRRVLAGPVSHAEVRASPRRAASLPARLPTRPLAFIGREAEQAELADRLAELAVNDLLVCAIDGPPGVGKTALAVEFAYQVRARFPDGCHYLDLRGLHRTNSPMTATEGLRVLLDCLGDGAIELPNSFDELVSTYRSVMADKRALLVLDDAKDVDQIRPLLAAGAGAMVVVTSRRRLGGLVARDGAVRISLDMLPPGHAVDMITSRLDHARESLDGAGLDDLARLCGDLPLALSFAADQLRAMPRPDAARLLNWLRERRTRLSRLNSITGSGRLCTVEEAFSWSLPDLDSDSVELFIRLGEREHEVTTAAATAGVTGWTVERARQALEELAMASLVDWGPLGTYQITPLLHVYAGNLALMYPLTPSVK